MISRNIPLVDKNVLLDPSIKSPVNLVVNTKTAILPDMTKSGIEVAFRGIQNVGTNAVFIGIGFQPDASNYSFILDIDETGASTLTDVTSILSCQAIYGFCNAGAGIVAAFQLYRNDLAQQGGPIRSGQLQAPG
jgi:hypothetical protein